MRRALVKLRGVELNRYLVRNLPVVQNVKIITTPPQQFPTPVMSRHICLTGSLRGDTEVTELTGLAEDPNRIPDERLLPKDRTKYIPYETSIKYMESEAYKTTYGDQPIWVLYRRNHKGQFAPRDTRRSCIRYGKVTTSNACPICRDEYLVLDYRHPRLLKQFLSPFNGEILHWDKTNICRLNETILRVEIAKARDYGTLTFDIPVREYDYDEYYNPKF